MVEGISDSTTITITIGLLVAIASGLTMFGWTTGRLFARLDALASKQDGLMSSMHAIEKDARANATQLGQRFHAMNRVVQDHELRLALICRELNLPVGPMSDRTPVVAMPPHRSVTDVVDDP